MEIAIKPKVEPYEGPVNFEFLSSPNRIGESVLQRIGNTPLLRIERLSEIPKAVEIYAKAEWFNPGGSVKDRPALSMILEGERSGQLTKDKTILDSTSGNTGIAYAMIGAAKGYRVELVMPANVSIERKKILLAYGAKITYSDPLEGSDGALMQARRIYSENKDKYFKPDQYNNPANWQAHYNTTGLEIIQQTKEKITHFLACIGTGGTLMGTGRRLRELSSNVKIIAVEPSDGFHGIEGLKHMESSIVPGIYDLKFPDETFSVNTDDAYDMTKRLAREEGLLVGQSSGAALVAALKLAHRTQTGVIVTVFPDGGDKYLSTRVWE